ncbi:MAG: hypothetical protein WD080_12605, partial [Egibacteraceae bacterium]
MDGVRRALGLVALLGGEIAAAGLLHRLGALPWLRVGWDDPAAWLAVVAAEDAVMAALRLVALAATYWLLASTVAYTLARATRLPAAIHAVGWATLPVVRRVADRAVAVTLAGSVAVVGAQGLALAEVLAPPAVSAPGALPGDPASPPSAAVPAPEAAPEPTSGPGSGSTPAPESAPAGADEEAAPGSAPAVVAPGSAPGVGPGSAPMPGSGAGPERGPGSGAGPAPASGAGT